MENEQIENEAEVFASWVVPEYHEHERDTRWYTIAISIAVLLLIMSFFTGNFLLPVIIIIVAFIYILQHGKSADRIIVSLNDEGMVVGQKFHSFDEFRNFSIVYKPQQGDKNLYFEFDSAIKPRLAIPLEDMNPVKVREFLLGHVRENLERTDIPLSEALTKIFKL